MHTNANRVYGTPTATAAYLTHYAASLVAFAKENARFRHTLLTSCSQLADDKSHGDRYAPPLHRLLASPDSAESATARLTWLMHELSVREAPETAAAQSELLAFAEEFERPKEQIIGIVGIAIIGPTLGIIDKKKKKKKSKLHTVIADRYQKRDRDSVSALAIKAAGGIVSDALLELRGDATRLEPELAEWFFEERRTKTHFTSERELEGLTHELADECLPHTTVCDETGLAALAISPTVDCARLGLET